MARCTLFLLLLTLMPRCVQGQDKDGLASVLQLEKQGQFPAAAEAAQRLEESPDLSTVEHGRAAFLLGIAEHQQGKFQQAAAAYDLALSLLGKDDENSARYAATLISYGILYRDMGRFDEGERVELKALRIYEKNQDHTGLATVCKSLAGLELARKRVTEGRKYLERSAAEAKLTHLLQLDFFASLATRQAELAELQKNYADAVVRYSHALDLWQHLYGERHLLVGWTMILVGKADAEDGQISQGLQDLKKGLDILDETVGPVNVHTLTAQVVYADVLDAAGSHAEAAEIRTKAKSLLHNFYEDQCLQCSVNVAALSLR